MDSFQSRQALPVFITGQKMQCMTCEDDDDDLKRDDVWKRQNAMRMCSGGGMQEKGRRSMRKYTGIEMQEAR